MTDFNEDTSLYPATTTDVQVDSVGNNIAELSWSGATDVTDWELLFRVAGTDAWRRLWVQTTAGGNAVATLVGLEASTDYEAAVRPMIYGYYPCPAGNIASFTTTN